MPRPEWGRFRMEGKSGFPLNPCVRHRSNQPARAGSGGVSQNRLGLEVAEAIAIEPALTQPEAASQYFLEHLSFEGADGGVGLGELVVRAGVLAKDRDRSGGVIGHFRLDSSVVKQVGELHQPPFPLLPTHLTTINLGETVGNPDKQTAGAACGPRRCSSSLPRARPPGPHNFDPAASAPGRSPGKHAWDARALHARRDAPPTRLQAAAPADSGSPYPSRPSSRPSRPPSMVRHGGSSPATLDPTTRSSWSLRPRKL